MPVPPPAPDKTVTKFRRPLVYGKNNEPPTEEDELEHWRATSVSYAAGSVPLAEMVRDIGVDGANVRLKDIRLDGKANHRVEVWLPDENGERKTVIFVGEVVEQQFQISPGNETERATATVPHYWFGKFCLGQYVWDPLTSEFVETHHDLEFNPMIDGVIVFNKSPLPGLDLDPPIDVWIDPESGRTEAARDLHNVSGDVSEWSLRDIVLTLTRWLNADEEFIKNPELDEDWASDAPAIKNVRLPRGHYLVDYLTMLLPPFGYDWYLGFVVDEEDGIAKPIIKLFRRGEGDEVTFDLDPIGEPIEDSNVDSVSISYNIGNIRNKIHAHGSLIERQFTFDLYRSWPESSDGVYDEDDSLDPVGRKFIANVSGDYTDVRPEITSVIDLSPYGDFVPKRHRPEDPLEFDDDLNTRRRAPYLEVSISGGGWVPVKKDYRILTDEFGVWFSKPPMEWLEMPLGDVLFRLTGTIYADKRVEEIYDDTEDSVNGRTVEALVDVERRFHKRIAGDGGIYGNDDIDDSDGDPSPLKDYVDRIGEIMRSATVGIAPNIPGIDLFYVIGDVVSEITGRNINLNCLGKDSEETRYPQITGITYEFTEGAVRTVPTLTPYSSNNPDERVRRRK